MIQSKFTLMEAVEDLVEIQHQLMVQAEAEVAEAILQQELVAVEPVVVLVVLQKPEEDILLVVVKQKVQVEKMV